MVKPIQHYKIKLRFCIDSKNLGGGGGGNNALIQNSRKANFERFFF